MCSNHLSNGVFCSFVISELMGSHPSGNLNMSWGNYFQELGSCYVTFCVKLVLDNIELYHLQGKRCFRT
jgi:hypothetical protein